VPEELKFPDIHDMDLFEEMVVYPYNEFYEHILFDCCIIRNTISQTNHLTQQEFVNISDGE
jgi:hypothetical protein